MKFFVEFEHKFWNDDEFIYILKERNDVLNWQNLDSPGFFEGSKTLLGTVVTEGIERLTGSESGVLTQDIVENVLLPDLYAAFGVDKDDPYYAVKNFAVNDWANDKYAAGCSGTPQIKRNQNFYPYFEQTYGEKGDFSILYISGSDSCINYSSLTQGGYFSGIRSVLSALFDRGVQKKFLGGENPRTKNVCDL